MKHSIRGVLLIRLVLAGIVVSGAAPAWAVDRMKLSRDCEIAVARSALPLRLRPDASVYALVDDRYELVVEGEGPFTCIVERNHRDAVIPQCMDRSGVDSVLPAIIDRSEMAVGGVDFEAIDLSNELRLASGHYHAASRPGVSYMMSDFTYAFVASAGQVLKIPPHVMFYAPNLTNADIGGSLQSMIENVGTPFVFREGLHGYMITYAEHNADPNEVAETCAGELGERPPSFDPFPKD